MAKKKKMDTIDTPKETITEEPEASATDTEAAVNATDDSSETVDGNKAAEPEQDPVTALEEKVTKAEEAASQAHERLLRATAEFENYKKRSARETAEFKKFANESLIKELLPVVDNLERAVESSGNDTGNGIVEGVEMTLREIFKVLEKFNLKALESQGKPFDPNFHQAVMQEETDEHPENTVLKEMQKGYILHDRLIRPAMVVVSKAKAKTDNGQETTKEPADQTND